MSDLSYTELLTLFDEITGILEAKASAAEKVERIEALMFEPAHIDDENELEEEEDFTQDDDLS